MPDSKVTSTLQDRNPLLAGEWHPRTNDGLTPTDVTPGSARKVWWLCPKGHEWEARGFKRNEGFE